jgi:opine dehydrogenase
MKITIIGAGNGGHAMAGHFGLLGYNVRLYSRYYSEISEIAKKGGVKLTGAINGFGKVAMVTDNIAEAVSGSEIIMIVTTATAHREIAELLLPCLEENQIIVLNPGRTCGAIEFNNVLKNAGFQKNVFIAEAQSLIYACRITAPAEVRIIGVKDKVLLATLPKIHTNEVCNKLNTIYDCFVPAENVLVTGLENIGAIFHPTVVLFNAATIERGQQFFFYNDMTPSIASFIENVDKERLEIGKAFGFKLVPAVEWISQAYSNIKGDNLCEKMKNNPAYYNILAPTHLNNRFISEDIPSGVLPMIELAASNFIPTPLLTSIFQIYQSLTNRDFKRNGRTLKNLGLEGKTVSEILEML